MAGEHCGGCKTWCCIGHDKDTGECISKECPGLSSRAEYAADVAGRIEALVLPCPHSIGDTICGECLRALAAQIRKEGE